MTILVFSNFSKKRNSTAQPNDSTGTLKGCLLKESTSVENPTFVLKSNDFTINYVKAFGHYYFVDDIVSVRDNLIEVRCSMDVLATYKTAIGNYNAFIERAASSSIVNTLLPDPLCVMQNSERVLTATTSGLSVFSSSGFYVITVLNTKGSGAGYTSYYVVDISRLEQLAAYANAYWGQSATTVTEWLQANFLKTSEAVISCVWLPFSFAILSGLPMAYEQLEIGVDAVTVGGNPVQGYRFTGVCIGNSTVTVSIPSTGYSDFRAGAPFTVGKLFVPCYGVVNFNPLDFTSGSITMSFDCDMATGEVACYLKDGSSLISTINYNVSVSCPIGKIGSNIEGVGGGLLTEIGGIIGFASASTPAGMAVGALAAVAGGANTIASAVTPTLSIKGTQGGRAIADNGTDIIVTLICRETTDPAELLTQHGGLVMEKKTIGNYTGYIKCSNASLDIAGMGGEKEAVNNYLNSGFYYE